MTEHMTIRWLAISNRENSEIIIKKNIWGVPKRFINQISKTRPGDSLIIYVGQQIVDKDTTNPPAITGVFEISSEVFEDNSRIFISPPKLGNEIFPLRVKIKPIKIFKFPLEFKPLIQKLQFITNKKMWSGHIRGKAMRIIPEEDYQTILNAVNKIEQ